jgi:hypothetical protein
MWSLNLLGSRIWRAVEEGRPVKEVAETLHRECDVPYATVCRDVSTLLTRLESLGLMRAATESASSPATSVPDADTSQASTASAEPAIQTQIQTSARPAPAATASRRSNVFTAFVCLLAVDVLFLFADFQRLCDLVRRLPVRARQPSAGAVDDALATLERAAAWYPKRALCLQRSCVLTCLLRRSGVAAELVLGARVLPFYAHAWVEVDGEVVGDRAVVREQYRTLTRC